MADGSRPFPETAIDEDGIRIAAGQLDAPIKLLRSQTAQMSAETEEKSSILDQWSFYIKSERHAGNMRQSISNRKTMLAFMLKYHEKLANNMITDLNTMETDDFSAKWGTIIAITASHLSKHKLFTNTYTPTPAGSEEPIYNGLTETTDEEGHIFLEKTIVPWLKAIDAPFKKHAHVRVVKNSQEEEASPKPIVTTEEIAENLTPAVEEARTVPQAPETAANTTTKPTSKTEAKQSLLTSFGLAARNWAEHNRNLASHLAIQTVLGKKLYRSYLTKALATKNPRISFWRAMSDAIKLVFEKQPNHTHKPAEEIDYQLARSAQNSTQETQTPPVVTLSLEKLRTDIAQSTGLSAEDTQTDLHLFADKLHPAIEHLIKKNPTEQSLYSFKSGGINSSSEQVKKNIRSLVAVITASSPNLARNMMADLANGQKAADTHDKYGKSLLTICKTINVSKLSKGAEISIPAETFNALCHTLDKMPTRTRELIEVIDLPPRKKRKILPRIARGIFTVVKVPFSFIIGKNPHGTEREAQLTFALNNTDGQSCHPYSQSGEGTEQLPTQQQIIRYNRDHDLTQSPVTQSPDLAQLPSAKKSFRGVSLVNRRPSHCQKTPKPLTRFPTRLAA